jgi:hypothetical protein
MELKLEIPASYYYNVGDHNEFNKSMLLILLRYGIQINNPVLLDEFQKKVELQEIIFNYTRRSEFTELKAITDQDRDRTLTGLMAMLRAGTKHFDPVIRNHAKRILNLIKDYGDLVNADYDAETTGIDGLLSKLNGSDCTISVQALGIQPWLVELEKYNNLFKSYVVDTEHEQIKKPATTAKVARKETDEALRKIMNYVTSLININGQEDYVAFVTEFNIHVDHYNGLVREHQGRIHVKIDITDAQIDPIPVQPYTGKPVNVIPVVKVRKEEKEGKVTMVELVFSKDFTVRYRNNINPGTASILITGKGKYTGEIVMRFHIDGGGN